MTEMRGNWEDKPQQSARADGPVLWWPKTPAERTCHLCRGGRMHTRAEHDLVYPVDRQTQLDYEREEERRQVEADNKLLAQWVADGMTEEQAVDELWRWAGQGRGLVEPRPRP